MTHMTTTDLIHAANWKAWGATGRLLVTADGEHDIVSHDYTTDSLTLTTDDGHTHTFGLHDFVQVRNRAASWDRIRAIMAADK